MLKTGHAKPGDDLKRGLDSHDLYILEAAAGTIKPGYGHIIWARRSSNLAHITSKTSKYCVKIAKNIALSS